MKRFLLLVTVIISLIFGGCTYGPYSVRDAKTPSPEIVPSRVVNESNNLNALQDALTTSLEKPAPRKFEVEPLMPAYDPLEDHTVSFSAVDEDLQTVLYSMARAVGMNLIIDPRINDETKKITLNFEKVSAAILLKEILNNFDLYYTTTGNVIRVRPYEERTFRLNFLDTNLDTTFEIGGDVLGAGNTETATGLTGNFRLSGKGAKKPNPYDIVDDMVKQVISPKGGMYSLNRLSGSLYVKDTPAVIKSIAMLINEFKERMSKQILIEARIIEVELSDGYQYGIDWNILRNDLSKKSMLNSAAWSRSGLVLSGVTGAFTSNATINMLNTFGKAKVVSNPTIRTKHGQPAIISVGTSITYKEKVKTTRYTDSSDSDRDTTEVDVSTVFDGLILGVIPFIEQDGKITLLINPIKSDVDKDSLETESVGNQDISLPKVNIKEISTTIGLTDGDIIILGGLIDKEKTKTNRGVPGLSAIPIIGYLFKYETMSYETRELVIILHVSIL
ncbi:MAG: pilus (MSHA type) biogenesis protein MshL [Deltaproteobacteria bacterium]|nr:pilus (MSHA type) biogenesis protein MshL [Deltaproteobacteria bacterium]